MQQQKNAKKRVKRNMRQCKEQLNFLNIVWKVLNDNVYPLNSLCVRRHTDTHSKCESFIHLTAYRQIGGTKRSPFPLRLRTVHTYFSFDPYDYFCFHAEIQSRCKNMLSLLSTVRLSYLFFPVRRFHSHSLFLTGFFSRVSMRKISAAHSLCIRCDVHMCEECQRKDTWLNGTKKKRVRGRENLFCTTMETIKVLL